MTKLSEYVKEKASFISRHGNEYQLDVTDKEFGDTTVSIRRYVCKDRKTWNEILSDEYVSANIEFEEDYRVSQKIRCTVTEYWSDDNTEHKKIYELTNR